MGQAKEKRVAVDGGRELQLGGAFAALDGLQGLPQRLVTASATEKSPQATQPAGRRGRVDVRRLTAGKGGKTVTELSGFQGISSAELEKITGELKRLCGVGGTLKERCIELQGDQRARVGDWLAKAGFRPVMSGG